MIAPVPSLKNTYAATEYQSTEESYLLEDTRLATGDTLAAVYNEDVNSSGSRPGRLLGER